MSDYIPNARNLNWIIGFGCMFLMGAALYMEHMMHLEPCPLCIFQRVAVIAAGLIAIAAALHNPAQAVDLDTGNSIFKACRKIRFLLAAPGSIICWTCFPCRK